MSSRLKINGLRTDISSVDKLLQQAIEYGDPIGKLQFSKRKQLLETEFAQLVESPEKTASIALYFGGEPVIGSRGISLEFAGNALEQFQELVSRTFAKSELGNLGERGPIPLKQSTKLMVTEIARGSFGFVLDEFSDQMEMLDTKLKITVEEVATLLERTASPNELEFEEVLETLDVRTLIALRDFFINLDSNKATFRLVEEKADYTLDELSIHRARQRTEAISIEEAEDIVTGVLVGFLPEHRKFEVKPDDGPLIYGSVSNEASEQYSSFSSDGEMVIGSKWMFKVRRRIVSPLNRPPREIIRLLEFLDRK